MSFDDDSNYHDGCYCPKCGTETRSRECTDLGCDEGYHDDYEDDPLWFDPGDFSPCSTCHGMGIVRWCPGDGCGWHWRGETLKTDRDHEEPF